MRWLHKRGSFVWLREEKGFSLIEIVVAAALLGIMAVAFLQALRTTSQNAGIYDRWVTAESLARSQLEYIRADNYEPTGNYTRVTPLPPFYSLDIIVKPVSDNVQQITVVVYQSENYSTNLTTIKAKW